MPCKCGCLIYKDKKIYHTCIMPPEHLGLDIFTALPIYFIIMLTREQTTVSVSLLHGKSASSVTGKFYFITNDIHTYNQLYYVCVFMGEINIFIVGSINNWYNNFNIWHCVCDHVCLYL